MAVDIGTATVEARNGASFNVDNGSARSVSFEGATVQVKDAFLQPKYVRKLKLTREDNLTSTLKIDKDNS